MSGRPQFVDTNVLVYAALENDPRSEPARALLATAVVFSVQALNEFVSAARKLCREWSVIQEALAFLETRNPHAVFDAAGVGNVTMVGRTEAHCESDGMAAGAYRVRACSRSYLRKPASSSGSRLLGWYRPYEARDVRCSRAI